MLVRDQGAVSVGAEEAAQLDLREMRLAQRAELIRVQLDVVVGVDDLVRAGEGQAVRGDEHGHTAALQHTRDLGERPLGVGNVLD